MGIVRNSKSQERDADMKSYRNLRSKERKKIKAEFENNSLAKNKDHPVSRNKLLP